MNTYPVITRFERRKQRTREQLKQAAIELILDKGYDAVSIQDITDRADLGRGTFYVHFRDKEDLVWTIMREGFDALTEGIRQRYGSQPPETYLYHSWRSTFEHAAEKRDLFRIMLGGQGSALLTKRAEEYLVQHIMQTLECMPFMEDLGLPMIFMANYCAGALVKVIVWWLETPNDYTPAQMASMFYTMIHRQPPNVPEGETQPVLAQE